MELQGVMFEASTIRLALKAEALGLEHDGSATASDALMNFALEAKPSELIRLYELIANQLQFFDDFENGRL